VMLSDTDLLQALHRRDELTISPLCEDLVQPASVDVRLADQFRVFDNPHGHAAIDPDVDQTHLTRTVTIGDGARFVLHPGEFALGATVETITLGTALAGRLEGKSSLGRLGLLVHSTAGFIDPGFTGTVTLELSNVNKVPIRLRPGMLIGQLCVFRLQSPATRPYGHPAYGSRYQGQTGPTASRSHYVPTNR
jgi:dCTP deaminase